MEEHVRAEVSVHPGRAGLEQYAWQRAGAEPLLALRWLNAAWRLLRKCTHGTVTAFLQGGRR